MRIQYLCLVIMATVLVACGPHQSTDTSEASTEPTIDKAHLDNAPATFLKVIDAHGGYDVWARQQMMTYTLPGKKEKHQVQLQSRKVRLEAENYTIGYDGQDVWIQQDSAYFGRSPRFYHNLYFYFIAMPFVLADPGIKYEEVPAINFGGVDYPGIKISYADNVGDSPDDNYILYYHPESFQMEWLAYTVTYRSQEASDNFKLIRYTDWKAVEGVVLPHNLTWFKYEEGKVIEPARDPMLVTNMTLSKTAPDDALFAKPDGAEVATD